MSVVLDYIPATWEKTIGASVARGYNHVFHYGDWCILQWVKNNDKCPCLCWVWIDYKISLVLNPGTICWHRSMVPAVQVKMLAGDGWLLFIDSFLRDLLQNNTWLPQNLSLSPSSHPPSLLSCTCQRATICTLHTVHYGYLSSVFLPTCPCKRDVIGSCLSQSWAKK